jgi:AhpD family alkylhydroperoxidase
MSNRDRPSCGPMANTEVAEIANLSPAAEQAYQDLRAVEQDTRLLSAKIRELIALSVAAAIRCDPCIAIHTAAATRHGATRGEITEALGIAAAVNAGAAFAYATRPPDACGTASNARMKLTEG